VLDVREAAVEEEGRTDEGRGVKWQQL